MNPKSESDRTVAEARFAEVFAHLEFIAQYARRRGARDPDGIAAEAMAIAWRRLADVPNDDPRPWLIVTTRNLLFAEHRRESNADTQPLEDVELTTASAEQLPFAAELDPELAQALATLKDQDREALLLIAWGDLTPTLAARSLGISAPAFRVRLFRARRRLTDQLIRQSVARPIPARQPRRPQWRQSA